MSTAQANLFEWKQEVNRRLAEHRSRKSSPAVGPQAVSAPQRDNGSSRSAEAAARVAQRFAHAPRYLDMLVDDARNRQAEEAQCAAVETAEVPAVSAGLVAVAEDAPVWESTAEAHAPAAVSDWSSAEPIPVRYAAEPREDARLFGGNTSELMEPPAEAWNGTESADEFQDLEAEALQGNLIEFPRELVATRKIRPRLVEGPLAATRSPQLSIFEVDPGTISTAVEAANMQTAAAWNQAEWSGIKLEAHPAAELAPAAAPNAVAEIELAPLSRRLLALVVDAALISIAVIAAGAVFAWNASAPLGPKEAAFGGVAAFVAATLMYDLLFFSLAHATPGMRYACIGLWTFGNERPTREQRWRRLGAMALSVLPAGLGLVWSLFDEERLCWHDRLSQTYLKSSF